jgi:hypothetical protein
MVGSPYPKESEAVLEGHTLQADDYLKSCPNSNIAFASEKFKVPNDCHYGRLKGKTSCRNHEGPNRKMSKD